jgi:hypothetical protein
VVGEKLKTKLDSQKQEHSEDDSLEKSEGGA